MKNSKSLGQRLWQAFIFQAILISLAALLGVYGASYVLEDLLIQQALKDESEHFWESYDKNNDFPRPNTYNLTGYLVPGDNMPDAYMDLEPGVHEIDRTESDFFIIHISEKDNKKLYLEFDGKQVGDLALYFGLVPLVGVLIVIYLSTWISYRFSTRAVSPFINLAKELETLDPGSTDFSVKLKKALPGEQNIEVKTLSSSLSALSDRIDALVMRERNFTRDASHELRSPITVIKLASDLLLTNPDLSTHNRKTVERIKNNAADMEELIEALLLLARESDSKLSLDIVNVNEVIKEEIERTQNIYPDKNIHITFEENESINVTSSDKVLSVLIGNLIRNAYLYTDEGQVVITLKNSILTIEDSGIGIKDEDVENIFKPFKRAGNRKRGGYGVGLTIVNLLSERFNWPIDVKSKINEGTRITIDFSSELT